MPRRLIVSTDKVFFVKLILLIYSIRVFYQQSCFISGIRLNRRVVAVYNHGFGNAPCFRQCPGPFGVDLRW